MKMMSMRRGFGSGTVLAVLMLFMLAGCGMNYVTPGGPANLRELAAADASIRETLKRTPAAQFPARLAVARVQDAGYRSWTCKGYGTGRYSLVTCRDLEEDEHINALNALPRLDGVVMVNRLLVGSELNDDHALRQAAASVHANLLLIYTLDTQFTTDDGMRPLSVISLGLFPTKNVRVGTTASAVLMDTSTGYIYGTAEATDRQRQLANAWTSGDAADQVRRRTEREAVTRLLDAFRDAWPKVIREYGG
jgi:hypothetical protein